MGRHGISVPDRHSPAPRSRPPRDRPTSPRWRRPRTSVAPTASCCRRRYAGVFRTELETPLDLVYDVRTTSHARDPSRRRPPASPLRASEGCDQVVAAPPSRSAARPRRGTARAHPRDDGNRVVRPGRRARQPGLLLHRPRSRRVQSWHQAARNTSGKALRNQLEGRGIHVRGIAGAASPRRSPRRTRTSISWPRPASRQPWHASRGSCPWAS